MSVEVSAASPADVLEADGPVVGRPVSVAGQELLAFAESEPLFERMVADIRAARVACVA